MAKRTSPGFVVGSKVPPPYGGKHGTKWVRVTRSSATKAGFTEIRFGYRLESGAWRWTGVLIESAAELNSRRLRALPMIGTLADLARGWLDIGKPVRVSAPRRRGRKGHPLEFWQQIADLYEQALKAAPRRHVAWIRANLPAAHRDVSEDTLRRWVRLVREGKKP
jgi:hypothetical protein